MAMSPAEIRRLDRIEAKVDRLLRLMGASHESSQVDDFRAVLAAGGVEALKTYVKNMPQKGGE